MASKLALVALALGASALQLSPVRRPASPSRSALFSSVEVNQEPIAVTAEGGTRGEGETPKTERFRAISLAAIDQLIDWDMEADIRTDPFYKLVFPTMDMLSDEHRELLDGVCDAGDPAAIKEAVEEIRESLNPHPAGQKALNAPKKAELTGVQHKYAETVLFFAAAAQTCHAYCTYCFRWAQFIGDPDLRFAQKDADSLFDYLEEHPEVSDILFTGGDPMIMQAHAQAVKHAIHRLKQEAASSSAPSRRSCAASTTADVWAAKWREEVRLGVIPYYMFIARDTGAQSYFDVPLVRAQRLYADAIRATSGLCRTARGPSMSCTPGKVEIVGLQTIQGTEAFVLRFLQCRDDQWIGKVFFANTTPRPSDLRGLARRMIRAMLPQSCAILAALAAATTAFTVPHARRPHVALRSVATPARETLWTPTAATVEASAMKAFQRAVGVDGGYEELWSWSVANGDAFWTELMDFVGVEREGSLEPARVGENMPDVEYFPNCRLNFAENLLRHGNAGAALEDAEAIVSISEARDAKRWAFGEPPRGLGVASAAGPGRRAEGLFVCDGFVSAGKRTCHAAKVAELAENLPSLEKIVVFGVAAAAAPRVVGEKAELACLSPFVAAPVKFFGDDEAKTKYRDAYFDDDDGVWYHGDLVETTGSVGAAGGVVIHGRSDTTLKPGGVRITAELKTGKRAGDVRIVLFVKLADGYVLDAALERTRVGGGDGPLLAAEAARDDDDALRRVAGRPRRGAAALALHSKNLAPGRMFGRSSTLTRTPSALHSATRPSTRASTAFVPASSFFSVIGRGDLGERDRGGSTRPASSGGEEMFHHFRVGVEHLSAVANASSRVAWAVWPSCQRNSDDRRKGRVRISQRTTFAHWLIFSGRSRWLLIHLPNMCQIMVSLVGRMIRGSSSSAAGSGSRPLAVRGEAVVRDDSALMGEALGVLRLAEKLRG
ncbi:synthetase [Aureococcus anophagefferens]|nr:synthetase [Aureococcus anophagefferens]